MLAVLAPILAATIAWWFGTGLLVGASGLGARARARAFAAITLAALAAVVGLAVTAPLATPGGAYAAFLCAIVLWSWHEASFLFGYVTGPRRTPCPTGAVGLRRFIYAAETLIHHELAVFATTAALVALSWGAPNLIGVMTFSLLWLMRLSAKFNLYLGVSNFTDELLPARLAHLKTYFGPPNTSVLFPITALLAIVIAGAAFAVSLGEGSSDYAAAGYALIGTLAALAALEHAFFVLPLRESALWRFALATGDPRRAAGTMVTPIALTAIETSDNGSNTKGGSPSTSSGRRP